MKNSLIWYIYINDIVGGFFLIIWIVFELFDNLVFFIIISLKMYDVFVFFIVEVFKVIIGFVMVSFLIFVLK